MINIKYLFKYILFIKILLISRTAEIYIFLKIKFNFNISFLEIKFTKFL